LFKAFADRAVYHWLGLVPGSRLGEAVHFFVYDTLKIFFLLVLIVFAVAVIRTFFPPARARQLLARRREFAGNVAAALLGIVTPFCSCSAVPLFIGFLEAGIPLGVTFSFLVSAPTVNEVALVLLGGLFGWKIALLYIAIGVTVAVVVGLVIGRLGLEREVEDYVYQLRLGEGGEEPYPGWRERFLYARGYTKDILRRVWAFVLAGIAVGAWVHGYVPVDFVVRYAGPGNPFAVPVAVLIGIPLYSNAAGTIPIVQALVAKGMPLGTVLALMMSIVAISVPELLILRRVLKPKLLAIFVGVVAAAIILTGYVFNFVLG